MHNTAECCKDFLDLVGAGFIRLYTLRCVSLTDQGPSWYPLFALVALELFFIIGCYRGPIGEGNRDPPPPLHRRGFPTQDCSYPRHKVGLLSPHLRYRLFLADSRLRSETDKPGSKKIDIFYSGPALPLFTVSRSFTCKAAVAVLRHTATRSAGRTTSLVHHAARNPLVDTQTCPFTLHEVRSLGGCSRSKGRLSWLYEAPLHHLWVSGPAPTSVSLAKSALTWPLLPVT